MAEEIKTSKKNPDKDRRIPKTREQATADYAYANYVFTELASLGHSTLSHCDLKLGKYDWLES